MRPRVLCAVLAASLTLTACGRAPLAAPNTRAGVIRTAAASSEARVKAANYAKAVKAAFKGQIARDGAVVTLSAIDQPTVSYDFSQTPRSGMVMVSMEGFTTQVSEVKLLKDTENKVIPAIVVTIAVQMALGGAKALAIYYLTHHNDFDKKEAVRAVVIGMGKALVQFVPGGAFLEGLVPIAIDLVMSIKKEDLKHIAEAAMKQVDKLVAWIKQNVGHEIGNNPLMLDNPATL